MHPASERYRLRATFEQVPALYDRARAPYPEALFDDVVALAGLVPGGRLLEIGCATGRATLPLARRGLAIVCVELGPRLAASARRNLAGFPDVDVVTAEFETWEPEGEPFDAVTAFTAFHWLDPEVRFTKPARLLRRDGALAVVETRQVLPDGGDSFWAEMQEDYDRLARRIAARPGGTVELTLLATLNVARRR